MISENTVANELTPVVLQALRVRRANVDHARPTLGLGLRYFIQDSQEQRVSADRSPDRIEDCIRARIGNPSSYDRAGGLRVDIQQLYRIRTQRAIDRALR
jgi:hypothetical protein